MLSLIAFAVKMGVSPRLAKPVVLVVGIALLLFALWGGKCAYDKNIIDKHEAKQDAANAKADRKADAKAAEQRRTDDTRLNTETAEIKEAVNEAGNDPAARRAAYYECVRRIQSARAKREQSTSC